MNPQQVCEKTSFHFGMKDLFVAVACLSVAVASAVFSPNDVSAAALIPWVVIPIAFAAVVGLLTHRVAFWLAIGVVIAPCSVLSCILVKWELFWPR